MTSVTVVETLIPTTPILGTTLSRTIRLRELSQEMIYNLCSQTKREPTRSKETKIKKIQKKKRFREDDVSVQNARDYNHLFRQDPHHLEGRKEEHGKDVVIHCMEDDGKLDSYGCKLNEKVCQTDLNQSCLNWLWKGNIQAEITVEITSLNKRSCKAHSRPNIPVDPNIIQGCMKRKLLFQLSRDQN